MIGWGGWLPGGARLRKWRERRRPPERALDQVRAIVDARIAALARRGGEGLDASLHAEVCACREMAYDLPCEAPVRLEAEEALARLEACEAPARLEVEALDDEACGRRLEDRACACMSLQRMLARLPENLNVPSVEPRPPNLHAANLSFAARLVIAVRDRFGGDAPRVYMAANISRQAYSQIVSDETRAVSKRTAIRFAFALRMTPEEARTLLKSAGYAFSSAQAEDFILQTCLEVNPPIWDLNAVNQLLREYRVDFQY